MSSLEAENKLSPTASPIIGASSNDVDLGTAARLTEISESNLTRWQALKKYPYAWFCVSGMIWTLILTSFESQAGGVVFSISQFRKHYGQELADGSYTLEAKWQSMLTGIPLAAQIVGLWIGSTLSDRFGRRLVAWCSVMCTFAFVSVEFTAKDIQAFVAGKTMNGLCLGIMQPGCVSYIADVSPQALKSSATILTNFTFVIGPMICYFINYFLSDRGSNDTWAYKALFASQWGFAAVSVVWLVFIPEAPTYYVIKGQHDKAKAAFMKILGDENAANEQLQIIEMTVAESQVHAKSTTYKDLVTNGNLRRTLISVFAFVCHPFCGVYFTGSYTTYYFQLLGYSDKKSFRFTLGSQTISLTGCIVAMFICNHVGRRTAMIWGLIALMINDLLVGVCTVIDGLAAQKTAVAFMMLYGGVYNAGAGSLAFAIASENATSALRTKTVAMGWTWENMFGMMWSFVLPYIFNPDEANLGGKTMFIFFGFSVILVVIAYLFQTETIGRSYDEVDELYVSRVPMRHFASYKTKVDKINSGEQFETGSTKGIDLEHVEKPETIV
uniref:MFS transporter n=1 Tax=Cyberlindnera americana TaxID=36016 RepID=A0A5P8N8D6_9ASCO|nr:MFS transporter [Cyberlindnera americana]